MAKLEAARAYIEEVAARLDSGETDLQVEGSIAKLFATETANACADAAIQALGGYGYIREYDVEKIKRDVKITTIYEGTSEIQQLIISTFRWRSIGAVQGRVLRGPGRSAWTPCTPQQPDLKADVLAALVRLLNRLFEEVAQGQGHPPAARHVPARHSGLRRRDRRGPGQQGRPTAKAVRCRASRLPEALRPRQRRPGRPDRLHHRQRDPLRHRDCGRRRGPAPSSDSPGFDYARVAGRADPRHGRSAHPRLGGTSA